MTVFSLDIRRPLHCMNSNYNYYYNVVMTNLGGPMVVGVFGALALLRRKVNRDNDRSLAQLMLFGVSITFVALLMSFLMLPAVTTATLKLLYCRDFSAGGGPVVLT